MVHVGGIVGTRKSRHRTAGYRVLRERVVSERGGGDARSA
jgi:hypothetical protein